MHLITPKRRPVLVGTDISHLPLFFLAGPVQGGGDWQRTMAEMLADSANDCIIVNPSRYDGDHPHWRFGLVGPEIDERQTDWERYYLRQAASDWHLGCIVFWLAEQVSERADGDAYATDTYGELGEWRGHMMHEPNLRVVIGAEKNFPRLSTIARNFEQALGPSFHICETMEETVAAAAFFAQPQLSFHERASA